MTDVKVMDLFPVPFLKANQALPPDVVNDLIALTRSEATTENSRSDGLAHTVVSTPERHATLGTTESLVQPHLEHFGELMFGEKIRWNIKEIWLNLLQPGGFQTVHSHANSFISGVVYLTESHPSTRTVFYRNMGGRDFAFTNEHQGAKMGKYNASRWAVPATQPGDLVLFPSYLLHEVPRNQGQERMTLALNAVPARLKSWDYELQFL